MPRFPTSLVLITLASALLAGCVVGPTYRSPELTLPSSYQRGAVIEGHGALGEDWWEGFRDPLLTEVVRRALDRNLDLGQAAARLDAARAAAAGAGAALLPKGTLEAAGGRTENSLRSPLGEVANAVGAPRRYASYSLGTQASWELDLFGADRRAREAAQAEAEGAAVNVQAARLAIAAAAADTYLELRGLQAELALVESQEQVELHLVDLVRRRAGEGVSSQRELERSIGELERVRAALPPLRAAIEAALDELDVLMGEPAGSHSTALASGGRQPEPPLPAGSASPGELLRRRPDIVVAERGLAASNARVGVAIAGYYPQLSLSGLVGLDSVATGSLLSGAALETAGLAGLRWRLFDFGRVDAEVAGARAREAQALARYRSSVLRATADVEEALSRFVESRAEAEILLREVHALTRARDQAQSAYEGGVLPLIEVLDADRDLLAALDRLAVARADTARASVDAFRALGGGWTG